MTFTTGKKHIRSFISILLSVIIITSSAMFTGCSDDEANEWLNEIFGMLDYEVFGDTVEGDAKLKMHVIDVGQGDSVLIQCGESNVLIDCGENGMGKTVQTICSGWNTLSNSSSLRYPRAVHASLREVFSS